MTITATQLRGNFTEFSNTVTYPDSLISFWLQVAYMMLPACNWGVALDLGAQLYAAHNLVLEGLANAEAGNGAPPQLAVGPIITKTVGEVTVTYDTASGVNVEDTHWNMTTYGTRFITFARQFGAGPRQFGIGCTPPGNAGAWPGVVYPANYPY
jgi:hypothetical protein